MQISDKIRVGHCPQCLKPGGSALIAAKTVYFGLDGGTLPLRALVAAAGGGPLATVASVSDGVAREVLRWTPC